MPTALSTINLAKDQGITYAPLLLAKITFADGAILRLSSAPLNTAEGGFQYGGSDYLSRLSEQNIDAVQQLSEQGIDVPAAVQLRIDDADKFVYLNYEAYSGRGFRGASLELRFIFWDADTSTFSSDSLVKFVGLCAAPDVTPKYLTVGAQAITNLQRVNLPTVPVQRTCPNIFPATAAQRQEGADDADSIFYRCGYSPDATGTNARGNYVTGTTPYTSCGYTREDCVARGMFKADSLTRITGRFSGISYEAQESYRSREYVSGQWLTIKNTPNAAVFGDYYPEVFGGPVWVQPPVIRPIGDGNSSRAEVVISSGEIEGIDRLVVNGIELPAANARDGSTYLVGNPLLRYNWINAGDRNGAPNLDTPWNGNGDPYGSLAAALIVTPRSVWDSSALPDVAVLVRGRRVRVYSNTTTYTLAFSNNPAWLTMQLLVSTNKIGYSDLDIQTFIDAAAVCDATVTYTDQNGASSVQARFAASVVLRERRAAAEALRGLLASFRGHLVPSGTGKLQLFIKQTLAGQQPTTAPDGSNYGSAVSSKSLAGVTTNGFVAYRFSESTIAREPGGDPKFRILQRPVNDVPNRVSFRFQDAAHEWAVSSVSIANTADVAKVGQEVATGLQVEGITSWDQARRIAKTYLDEQINSQWIEFTTSFRSVKLRVGHIIMVNMAQFGMTDKLFRVAKIQPGADFESAVITAHSHDDNWYLDINGQSADPRPHSFSRDRLERPALPWIPGAGTNNGGGIYPSYETTFGLQQEYATAADGTAIARLAITGFCPVNGPYSELRPPLVAAQGTTASTGGSLAGSGQVYWLAVCATNASGVSALSSLCAIAVTAGGSANTVTMPVVSWDPAAIGYRLFAGTDPNRLTFQRDTGTTPTSITLSSLATEQYGPPDQEFDRFRVRVKRVIHSGVWGAAVTAVAANKITISGAACTVNEWAGRKVSTLRMADNPIGGPIEYAVSANSATELTCSPDPNAGWALVGDVVVMRTIPTVGSDVNGNYIEDAKWVNGLSGGAGLTVDAEIGNILRCIGGTGRGDFYRIRSNTATRIYIDGDWTTTPDSSSVFIVEEPGWAVEVTTGSFTNDGNPLDVVQVTVDVPNLTGSAVLVQVRTVDGGGAESIEHLSPLREIYIQGSAGTAASLVVVPTY